MNKHGYPLKKALNLVANFSFPQAVGIGEGLTPKEVLPFTNQPSVQLAHINLLIRLKHKGLTAEMLLKRMIEESLTDLVIILVDEYNYPLKKALDKTPEQLDEIYREYNRPKVTTVTKQNPSLKLGLFGSEQSRQTTAEVDSNSVASAYTL